MRDAQESLVSPVGSTHRGAIGAPDEAPSKKILEVAQEMPQSGILYIGVERCSPAGMSHEA